MTRNSNCWYSEVCQMDNSCGSCVRYIEMKYLMDNSGLPPSKQHPVDLYPSEQDFNVFVELREYKDSILEHVTSGDNLFIGGNTGNGKTSWAIKILLKYFDSVWLGNGLQIRGLFVHVPTLLSKLKNFGDPLLTEYRENLSKADLIIWDEIGGTGMSNYDYSQLLMYIDNRLLNGKSNIYTANIKTLQQCEKFLGERLASRVWNSSTVKILNGEDMRSYAG